MTPRVFAAYCARLIASPLTALPPVSIVSATTARAKFCVSDLPSTTIISLICGRSIMI